MGCHWVQADGNHRFTDCEKWRKEFGGGVDELTKNFDYVEKPKVFEFYPQYYHKTDKVCNDHTIHSDDN